VIDAMTLFDVEELTRYWTEHPPLHLTIAAYLGAGRQRRPARSAGPATPVISPGNRDVGQLLAELGPGFAGGDVHRGLSEVVLNFAELRQRSKAGTE